MSRPWSSVPSQNVDDGPTGCPVGVSPIGGAGPRNC